VLGAELVSTHVVATVVLVAVGRVALERCVVRLLELGVVMGLLELGPVGFWMLLPYQYADRRARSLSLRAVGEATPLLSASDGGTNTSSRLRAVSV
jgi:hypothetical protein